MDDLILLTISAAFCMMFGVSGLQKARNLASFRQAIADYQLLPGVLTGVASILLTVFELQLAAGWCIASVRPMAAWSTIILLTVYMLAMSVNLLRGRNYIDCGCSFGAANSGQPLSVWLLVRNLLLIMLATPGILAAAGRPLAATDILVLVASLLIGIILHAAFTQLMLNHAAIASWRRSR